MTGPLIPPHLRPLIDDIVARAGLDPGHVVEVDWRPCGYASSARLHELDIGLSNGHLVEAVHKELGRKGLLPAAHGKPMELHDPEREINVYRQILALHPLGTAGFLGSVVHRPSGRYWLAIERIPGLQLRDTEVGTWDGVAAVLGRMHVMLLAVADQQPAGLPYLDGAYFRRMLTRARRIAAPDPGVRRRLAWVAAHHGQVVDTLSSLTPTLIHGQLYPSNVVVDDRDLARVCIVDWESAAIGPGVLDLAALTTGLDPGREFDAIVNAYMSALDAAGARVVAAAISPAAVAAAHVHLALQWLGWSSRWDEPQRTRRDWLREAEAATEILLAAR